MDINLNFSILCMGASTVKWTAPGPCLVFNESDSKLCINVEFFEKKRIGIFKTF